VREKRIAKFFNDYVLTDAMVADEFAWAVKPKFLTKMPVTKWLVVGLVISGQRSNPDRIDVWKTIQPAFVPRGYFWFLDGRWGRSFLVESGEEAAQAISILDFVADDALPFLRTHGSSMREFLDCVRGLQMDGDLVHMETEAYSLILLEQLDEARVCLRTLANSCRRVSRSRGQRRFSTDVMLC